jgi:hypothetical protein
MILMMERMVTITALMGVQSATSLVSAHAQTVTRDIVVSVAKLMILVSQQITAMMMDLTVTSGA